MQLFSWFGSYCQLCSAAMYQAFTSSGEMNISSCPITYFGQKYEKVYVSYRLDTLACLYTLPVHNVNVIFGLFTNTTTYDQDTCSAIICDVYGVARVVSDCGPKEHCQGDGSCAPSNVCTVAGSTIIDINGKVHTVPDRCGYTLLSPGSIPGLKVYGVFQERRRRDVSVKVSLEQGGRVKLNGDVLKLNATAQVFSGVKLSKDKTGVTAKISTSNGAVSVFFDGDKALIQLSGTVQGLCGGSSKSFSGEKVAEYSSAGCNLLKQAPFTACHNLISPEPFVTACTNTLCKYPAVDDIKCKLLETYTIVCSKQGNVKVEDWRTKTSCCKNSCQDKFCSDHEFCGQKFYGGEPRCFCRAIFASKYRSKSSYGEPTACEHSSAAVTLANCLLEEEGIDYSALHLNDQTCKGEMKDDTHMVTFKFDSSRTCGTVVKANDSKIIYKNTITTQNNSIVGHIYRHDRVHIDFSCFYNQPDIKSLAIKWGCLQQITSGAWIYNLTMKAYTDPLLLGTIESSTNIRMNERIWVALKTEGLDENAVQFVTESCWATNEPSPSGNLRYDLIIKGCPNPADDTVTIENNGRGPYNVFSFKTFQFTDLTGDVYLHCKVQLCVMQGGNCVPVCQQAGRWRRSIMSSYEDENPALITMAWSY
uniref:Alpha-tectorin-like n=1 Tax=Labrus bergylta TaxID=56723 RepID=A0A3Q3N269_9LABR